MDPVTAFSLVAGVLQVVDLSIKALSKCREITKDGSLAQHRDTEEIANLLCKCDHQFPTLPRDPLREVTIVRGFKY